MLSLTLAKLLALLSQYGYVAVLPVSILEGPIVAILGGFLVSLGKLNGVLIFFILLVGDMIGDTLYYSLGRWGREKFIERWGKYIGVTEKRVRILEKYFDKHDWKILFFAKTQPVGAAILFTGGVAKMPYKKFIWYNFLGSCPKIIIFELIGFYFGEAYVTIQRYLNFAGLYSLLIAIVLLVVYWLVTRFLKSKISPDL